MDKIIPIEEVSYLLEEQNLLKVSQNSEQTPQLKTEKVEEQYLIKQEKPLLVLITGGAASGKTTFTRQIKQRLEQNQKEILTLSIDSYYSYSPLLFQSRNPILHQIFQWEELNKDLETLLAGKSIYLPTYDNSAEQKLVRSTVLVDSVPVIILEGILAFFKEEIREKSHLKIYLEVDDNLRLERRLKRYQEGLTEGKFQQSIEYERERFYKGRPKENQETYVEPTKQYADLVVDNDGDEGTEKAIEAIREKLKQEN